MLQALIDKSQEFVAGTVRLKLYKGNVAVVGRSSPYSLYSESLVTFEDDKGAYDQKDAAGLHQAQCAAPADLGHAQAQGRQLSARAHIPQLTSRKDAVQFFLSRAQPDTLARISALDAAIRHFGPTIAVSTNDTFAPFYYFLSEWPEVFALFRKTESRAVDITRPGSARIQAPAGGPAYVGPVRAIG